MAFPAFYKPSATNDLIRLGPNYDGGYVLPRRILDNSDFMLSMGLSNNWAFEEDFCSKADARVVIFDPSVDLTFWFKDFCKSVLGGLSQRKWSYIKNSVAYFRYKKFFDGAHNRHIKEAIGNGSNGTVSLKSAMDLSGVTKNTFLKVDIEGAEYLIFEEIVEHAQLFTRMAMELHDISSHENEIRIFFEKLNPHWALVHFHANDYAASADGNFSSAVEVTFISRTLLNSDENLTFGSLPIANLDFPNGSGRVVSVSFK